MIYHQVRMAVKPDAPEDQVQHALGLMRELGDKLDVVEYFMVGRDVGGEFQYGAMYAVKDIDAYRVYMYDPLHREIDSAGLPLVTNMVSMDLTDDPDPQIADKIDKVHRDRFKDHPELNDLIQDLGSYEGSGTTDAGATPA
ncbi:Dabb family protein [Actinomadura darangshiensis]|uniref:Dabb family protein n=1 Tax=Actinomadura darangshiensis TaxID=705336 RepID=A0A4R5B0M7_9ACTN|nr:Dabb family protein [Actinomadura darangshiensis]TDD79508.1 Dabb family protein [Actinomadura darangshiensis]